MPHPTEEQRRPVLSIDLGASYTKLAWRPPWDDGDLFSTPSCSLAIDGEFYIPSIAVDITDGKGPRFGTEAAGLNPGTNGRTYRNWKSILFGASPDPHALSEAHEIAEGYLRWIKRKLGKSHPEYDLDNAKLRICIPALNESTQGEKYLGQAAKAAGWSNAIQVIAEPRANLIGLASSGKNVARNAGGGLSLRWGDMFSSLFVQAMQAPILRRIATPPVRFAVIDIGAFTTDIGICAIERTGDVKMSEGDQRSFKEGIADLDEQLEEVIHAHGITRQEMNEIEFSIHKKSIYQGQRRRIVAGNTAIELEPNCMSQQITDIARRVVGICKDHISGCPWYILTGGGFEIPLIREHVKAALDERGMRAARDSHITDSDRLDSRLATALGGASLAFDRGGLAPTTGARAPQNTTRPSVQECSCRGRNKDCARCHGKGVIEIGADSPKPVLHGRIPVTNELAQAGASDTFIPPKVEEVKTQLVLPEISRISRGSKAEKIYSADQISVDDLSKQWNEAKALAEFTLDGWMGELVFGEKLLRKEQRKRFLDHSSASGMRAWLRLLCLATCFGVRTKPRTIEKFWRTRLKDVWWVFTPDTLPHESEDSDWRVLDEVFLKATHLQFHDLEASGEDAELWRRVFYDFRKLHQFVYRNSFPAAILEVAGMRGTMPEDLVNFMKSGLLPNVRWAGVLGQSMTSPLFFVLRELRRLDVIDSRFDPVCFYMNSPARNVATRLGWIKAEQGAAYGIEKLTEFSTTCHKRMKSECPELSPFYDLALQWYDFNNW